MRKLFVPSIIILSLVIVVATYVLYRQQQEKLNFEKLKWEQEQLEKKEKNPEIKKDASANVIQPTAKKSPVVQLDASFEQKQECQKYKPEIEIELQKEEQRQSVLYSSVSIRLDKIFYSEVKKTCIYTTTERDFDQEGKIYEPHWLVDILSNDKTVYGRTSELNSPDWKRSYQDFLRAVHSLESPLIK